MRKRILICYTTLLHYRVPIFSRLGREYSLTVAHSGNRSADSSDYEEVVLPAHAVGRFQFQTGLWQLVQNGAFDSIIFFADLAYLSIMRGLLFCPTKVRRLTWGLWLTKSAPANFVRKSLAHLSDGNIHYSAGHAVDFAKMGVSRNKLWVARNTVSATPPAGEDDAKRNTLLFIGTINERKRCDLAIEAFANVLYRIPSHVSMVFVGDGPSKASMQRLAEQLSCSGRVEFLPGTTDPAQIAKHYSQAIASFSIGQAGLSVLQSLGHGVGFITSKGAVSGGETENLCDNYNSLICSPNLQSLEQAFQRVCNESEFSRTLRRNAYFYYQRCANVDVMVDGFIGAIENQPQDWRLPRFE